MIPGQIKDEIVILGNHRDAWVYGAADPSSGTATLVEVIKGFGALLQDGWIPRRTIVFASWDGEEVCNFFSVLPVMLSHTKFSANRFSTELLAALNMVKTSQTSSRATLSRT